LIASCRPRLLARDANDPRLVGEDDRLDPVAQVQFVEDVRDVGLGSVLGKDKLGGDLRVREPAGDQRQHLELSWGQLGERRRRLPRRAVGEPFDQPPGDGRREQRRTDGDDPDPGDQVLLGRILEQEAARSGPERLVDVLVQVERR
jgi:hypothetical protein